MTSIYCLPYGDVFENMKSRHRCTNKIKAHSYGNRLNSANKCNERDTLLQMFSEKYTAEF